MKSKTRLIFLLFVLITILSGCLPSVPKKITGPTWTSNYRIPIIDQKRINLGSEDEEGLGLENVSINYESTAEKDGPTTLNLFEERMTIDPGSIPALGFSAGDLPINGEYEILDAEAIAFSFAGLDDYLTVTLSDETTSYNYIEVYLENATAGNLDLCLQLTVDGAEEKTVTIPTGENYGQLKIPGLLLSPSSQIKIEATGSINISGSNPTINFNPAELEIEAITFDTISDIEEYLTNTDPQELFSFDFPTDADVFELQLKTAEVKFTEAVVPDNLEINVGITIKGLDENGNNKIWKTWPFPLQNGGAYTFDDLQTVLNDILKTKPQRVEIWLDGISVEFINPEDQVTIRYPGEISLYHNVAFALDYLTSASSSEGPEGSMEIPEDLPLEFEKVNLFVEIENTSPAGLALEVWLAPSPINKDNPASDLEAVKKDLAIAAEAKETSVLTFDPDEFRRLIEAETIHHLIKFINQTETADPIEAEDYLKVAAWAEAVCTINKR